MSDYDLTYLSLGAGVQSSAMLVLSNQEAEGVPRADFAVFADTRGEPQWVYDQVERLRNWSRIPIHTVSAGDLAQDIIDRHNGKRRRFAAIPAWTMGNDGRAVPLKRQCTAEYKIRPIEKFVRGKLGYRRLQRVKAKVRCLIGISYDECIRRARPSRTKWITNQFPLAMSSLTRKDCIRLYREHTGYEKRPQKSSCVFCPYHSDEYWLDLKQHFPEEFARAIEFGIAIRDMSMSGVKRPVFLHRACKPLEEVDFTRGGQRTFDFFREECDGMCGL